MKDKKAGRLSGRVALVTGGSRGIGSTTCLAFAVEGAKVAVHYNRNVDLALKVVERIVNSGGSAVAVRADLVEPSMIEELYNNTIKQLGPVDILVNNAGEMTDFSISEMSNEAWEQTIALNLSAAFYCSRACIPSMKERRWGRIINISSQAAFSGSSNHAHYATAKSGLLGFTYSLARELGSYGITVNAVSPGRILTEMIKERMGGREQEWLKQTPLGRFGLPEEVAEVILFLASESASYVTGANIHVNGGLIMG